MLFERFLTIFVTLAVGVTGIRAADLSVADTVMSPGATATVVVLGSITGESTYAVTIMLEIIPRGGNTGTVVFTPEPPVDIVQLGDPWPPPLGGLFSRYDTLTTFSSLLNGSLDDNGSLLPDFVTFPATYPVPLSEALSGFPVQASAGAAGVWDVTLTTSIGNSYWESVTTTLFDGVITICGDSVVDPPEECDDGNADAGEGCSSACAVENGWGCTGQPSVCTTICSDGICTGDENPDNCPEDCGVPAVSEWGLVAMVLLVLMAGTVVIRRRPYVA